MVKYRRRFKPVRKPGQEIPDCEILELMAVGRIVVLDYLHVLKFHISRNKHLLLKPHIHHKGGRVFYNIRIGLRNRKVFRSRLFWLWSSRELIPDGMTIDHRDHINTNDHPENLRLREFFENSCDNWSAKSEEHGPVPF
jgi:hypothetical protein